MESRYQQVYRVVRRPPSSPRVPCAAGCHRTAARVGGRCKICYRDNRPVLTTTEAYLASAEEAAAHERRIVAEQERVQRDLASQTASRPQWTDEERREIRLAYRRRTNANRERRRKQQKELHQCETGASGSPCSAAQPDSPSSP